MDERHDLVTDALECAVICRPSVHTWPGQNRRASAVDLKVTLQAGGERFGSEGIGKVPGKERHRGTAPGQGLFSQGIRGSFRLADHLARG